MARTRKTILLAAFMSQSQEALASLLQAAAGGEKEATPAREEKLDEIKVYGRSINRKLTLCAGRAERGGVAGQAAVTGR